MKFLLFFGLAVLFTGCAKETIFAVSSADNSAGGVYAISEKTAVCAIPLPRSSYIVHHKNKLYVTSNAARKSADKSGFLNTIDAETLNILNQMPVNGITPCHLTVAPDGKFVYTVNYSSGNLSEIPLVNGIPCPPGRLIQHSGSSVNLRRQKSAHPHFAGFDPQGRQLFVCDLGTDEIWIYNYIPGKGVELPCVEKLKLPPGSGPRHLALAPDGDTIYVANELSSSAASFYKEAGRWRLVKNLSSRSGKQLAQKNFPGAIKVTSDGKFFFITNRGDDTIAVFKTSERGNFELIANVDAQGQYPSDILLDENNQMLWTINMKNGTAVKFKMNLTAGALEAVPGKIVIPRGISLCK